MPEKKTLNEDLFYKGSSASLPRLHMCKNKVPFWDFKEFAVTQLHLCVCVRVLVCVCVCVCECLCVCVCLDQ